MEVKVTWNQVEQFVKELSRTNSKFCGVYGPARGGLVLAVMISHAMRVPLLMSPCKGCLIVDDIVDSGETLEKYHKKQYCIASMYYCRKSSFEPSFWMFEKKEEWIKFPWEMSRENASRSALSLAESTAEKCPSIQNMYRMDQSELDNYVCWEEPGIPTALASAMLQYWSGNADNFYSWVLNLAHRLFCASSWDRVIDYEDMQTHENYAILAKHVALALIECSKAGYPECFQSEKYKQSVVEVSEAIRGNKTKASSRILNSFAPEKSDLGCAASTALRYYFLAKYHADGLSPRNPDFDWKNYDRAVASVSTKEYKSCLPNYDSNSPITHKELCKIVEKQFMKQFT